MAILENNLFSGVLGPCVLKAFNGKQLLVPRISRGRMKQTKATRAAAKNFATASAIGSDLRKSLNAMHSGGFDLHMMNRLTAQLIRIERRLDRRNTGSANLAADSYAALEGFEFNAGAMVSKLLYRLPELSLSGNTLQLNLPVNKDIQPIKFPQNSHRCIVYIQLSLFRLSEGLFVRNAESQQIAILKNTYLEEPRTFNFVLPAGCLCIVSLFLGFSTSNYAGSQPLIYTGFHPGRICKTVITEGKYQENDERIWTFMRKRDN